MRRNRMSWKKHSINLQNIIAYTYHCPFNLSLPISCCCSICQLMTMKFLKTNIKKHKKLIVNASLLTMFPKSSLKLL